MTLAFTFLRPADKHHANHSTKSLSKKTCHLTSRTARPIRSASGTRYDDYGTIPMAAPVMAIRAIHKPADRDLAVDEFNNADHPSRVLVVSLRIFVTSVNLQKCCYDAVLIDVSTNAQTLIRAGGRGRVTTLAWMKS